VAEHLSSKHEALSPELQYWQKGEVFITKVGKYYLRTTDGGKWDSKKIRYLP
jgi:hypothetical protein